MNPDTAMRVQGGYYFITGVWPLVHLPSFLLLTGPKADIWLVKTIALMFIAIGSSLWVRPSPVLSLISVAALAYAEVYYAGMGRISTVYLADAVVQVLLLIWVCAGLIARRPPS